MQKVYNNVVDHRLIDGGEDVEDITSVTLPNLEHSTAEINVAGMAAAVEVPDVTHYNAMEFSVAHNNGVNGSLLGTPGKHQMEFRLARQLYNVAKTDMGYESVKYRVTGLHKTRQFGTVERGNPTGYTDVYSVIRFEEEVAGKIVTLVDAASGIVKINGRDYTSPVQDLLK